MRTLIVDNYDSFTFNLFHLVASVTGSEPLVARNDAITWEEFEQLDIDNVVISPGPGRPENERDFGICRRIILESQLPIFGVCLGLQGLGYVFGGKVVQAPEPVHGRLSKIFHDGRSVFAAVPQGFRAVRYHSLMVAHPVPDCLRVTAWTEDELVMGLEHRDRPIYSVQFHPESICTEYGAQLLKNFASLRRPHRALRAFPVGAVYDRALFPQGWELSTFEEKHAVIDRAHREGHSAGSKVAEASTVFTRRLSVYPSAEATFSQCFGDQNPAFWLDTADRFSFMGAPIGPSSFWLSYSTTDQRITLNQDGRQETFTAPLFDFLQTQLDRRRVDAPELPFDFNGGFVGYLGYELKAECGSQSVHRPSYPDACLIFPDRVIALDHHEHAVHLVYIGAHNDAASAAAWFDETERLLAASRVDAPAPDKRSESMRFELEQDRETYLHGIEQCLRWIREGESYEICLTNRLSARTAVDPLVYYRTLRRSNPAPYSSFLRFPQASVASSSPELFLKIDRDRFVESKPIKGTAPRSVGEKDTALREALRTSVKTRSENLMIVDLLRHDLGRVSEVGSVYVPAMMEVESYPTVHQLVSTVRGRLRPDATAIDCLRSAFPGGSMTGAPKLRTMELIDRLEASARGVYSGAIGFLALNGTANFNIVIRTAVFAGGVVSIGAGGAIVALSNPEAEFDEMILKSRALIEGFKPLVRGDVSVGGLNSSAGITRGEFGHD